MANYYQIGGSLDYDAPTYIERQADKDLCAALLAGEFCYVFNSRQMGKSSLMVRSWHHLQAEGHRCAVVDVTNIGSDHITPEQWYRGLMGTLAIQLNLRTRDIRTWWEEHSHLSLTQILSQFIELLLTQYPEQRLFIFVDEVDSLLNLSFSVDDFFALIRYCYNRRAVEPDYRRLTFAIFGVASPADLIADKQRTPFNIGRAVVLKGFSLSEATPLAQGLTLKTANTKAILQEVLNWTGGQPFLTQKVCQLLVTSSQDALNEPLSIPPGMEKFWVETIVRSHIITHWESQDEPEHLRTIRDRLLYDERRTSRLLGIYQRWLEGNTVAIDDSRDQVDLLLSGLMVHVNDYLVVKNQIYERVFDLAWIHRQLTALRPYSESIDAWVASSQTDESRLLRGQALRDAQTWARGKSLSDVDYRFLAGSQEQEQLETQRTLDLEKAQAAKRTTRLQRTLLAITSGALVIVSLLGLAALQQYRQAAASDRTSRLNEIRALISSAEGRFASHQELDALMDAVKAKRRLEELNDVPLELIAASDRALNQIIYWMSERNRFSGHEASVLEVAYSPDGKLVATTSADQTVKLWAKNGQLLHSFTGNATTFGLAFHPQQPLLAATNLDGSLQIWNLETKKLEQTIQAHEGATWDVDFSPMGDFLVSGGADQQVKVWSLDGRLLQTLSGHQRMVWQVAVSPTDQTISSASLDGTAKVWTAEGQLISTIPAATADSSIWSVAFSPTKNIMAMAGDDAVIQLWESATDSLRSLTGHTERIDRLAFSADGGAIASTALDKTIRIWGKGGNPWRILQLSGEIRRIGFSPHQSHSIVTAGNGVTAQMRQWQTPLLKTILLDGNSWDVAISSDGERIIGGDGSQITVWDTRRNIMATLQAEQDTFLGFDFSPDGQLIATASRSGNILLWNQAGRFLRMLEGHQFQSWDAAFSPDSQRLAAGAEDGTIRIWTVDGQLLHTLSGHDGRVYRVAFSPDGQQLVSSGADGTVQIWDQDGTPMHQLEAHDSDIFGLSVSPDGQFFASASVDQTVKLWRWDGTLVRTFEGHSHNIYGVDFSPDSQLLATASADNTVNLWTLDGEKLKTLYGNGSGFKSVKFSSTGELLVTVAENGTLTLWNLDTILTLNELGYACDWLQDYLSTNADLLARDRTICEGVITDDS
ncbi:wd40 repeat-containing protein [Leptolyngbya sp. Heron Island J]|uniref:WD40 domain-containing protein n=1 Tax=Leptolyngbya sp. Heron Island J TaxID=1385935 RepID=UPI0003B9D412|nr:AAA-like domain-containing protein [Leptolyngbya sp. Heron Island J]ESA35895.1 wd40 repeat-containing protein [Leptolyngbya sp. Heron Island J]